MDAAILDFSADREEGPAGPRCEGGLTPRTEPRSDAGDYEKPNSREEVSQPRGRSFLWMILRSLFFPLLRHAPRFDSCQAGHNSSSFFLLKSARQNPRE